MESFSIYTPKFPENPELGHTFIDRNKAIQDYPSNKLYYQIWQYRDSVIGVGWGLVGKEWID